MPCLITVSAPSPSVWADFWWNHRKAVGYRIKRARLVTSRKHRLGEVGIPEGIFVKQVFLQAHQTGSSGARRGRQVERNEEEWKHFIMLSISVYTLKITAFRRNSGVHKLSPPTEVTQAKTFLFQSIKIEITFFWFYYSCSRVAYILLKAHPPFSIALWFGLTLQRINQSFPASLIWQVQQLLKPQLN